jgi:septal ring factor EnvC (AmiA/AmiB activator)
MAMRLYITAGIIIVLISVAAFGDTKDDILIQQQEMEKIKSEVKRSREKLDSLKQSEIGIQQKISEGDQKLATDKKVISRLNRELRQLRQKIEETSLELDERQLNLELTRRRYLGNIRQFYLTAHKPAEIFSENPNEELVLHRQVVYLTSLANFESGNVDRASEYLAQTLQAQDELTGESRKVSRLKKSRESSSALVANARQKHQKSLERVRREKTEEADRVLMLEQAAREMEAIITRLQQEMEERVSREGVTGGPSVFAALKGQLLPPCRGEVTVPFGELIHPVTKLKSFSAGISIKTGPGQKVVAVASGTVAYVGNLRGYGNFIIINHDDRYYTTYAGLGEMLVSVNEYVLAGNKVASAGDDGIVKFELREGRNPLDPIKWISIDSF